MLFFCCYLSDVISAQFYTFSLHDALPISLRDLPNTVITPHLGYVTEEGYRIFYGQALEDVKAWLAGQDRKSTRLNSSHTVSSYGVFCLKNKWSRGRGGTCG